MCFVGSYGMGFSRCGEWGVCVGEEEELLPGVCACFTCMARPARGVARLCGQQQGADACRKNERSVFMYYTSIS